MDDLQRRHGSAQKHLLEELKGWQGSGDVSDIKPHWITNLVEARVYGEVRSPLAEQADVELI